MPCHAQLLIDAGFHCLIRGKLALGSNHIAVRHGAGIVLSAHKLQILPIDRDNIGNRFLLGANRGDLNRLGHGIAGQR